MEPLIRIAGQLPIATRSAVEDLLGHPLRDDEPFCILTLHEPRPKTEPQAEAWAEVNEIIAEAHRNVNASGLSAEEIERVIDDACYDVRHGK